jgi:hypothetical protein
LDFGDVYKKDRITRDISIYFGFNSHPVGLGIIFCFFELKRTSISITIIDTIEAAAIIVGNGSGSGEGVGDGSGIFEPLKA